MPKAKVNSAHLHQLATIFKGMEEMIEKGAIKIQGNTVSLFPELWQRNPEAFMANTYRYLRLKLKRKEGIPVYFKDIETDKLIGKFLGGKAQLI